MNLSALGMSQLPAQRAFVVQFSTESDVAQEQFSGRIEHVTSGQAAEFYSLYELLSFMRDVLLTKKDP